MRRPIVLSVCVTIFAGLLVAFAEEAKTESVARRVAFVGVGEVPACVVTQAAEWAQLNLATRVDVLPAQRFDGRTLDDAAAVAIKAAGSNHPHVVAIVLPPPGIENHGMRTADGRGAVVNLRPMQAGQPDATQVQRRVERQAIRAMTRMLDMQNCVNPQCALSEYGSLQELDRSGRNLCPPCLLKYQQRAESVNLEFDPQSPYLIKN